MEKLTIFYDGACVVCHREMMRYKNQDVHSKLEFIDISSPLFRAEDHGLDPKEVELHIHSKSESGEIYKGVDTFAEVWKRVPPYDKLTPVLSHELFKKLLRPSYNIFAHYIRPRLPKRDCEDGVCSSPLRE